MSYMSAMDGVKIGVGALHAGLSAALAPPVPLSAYYRHEEAPAPVVGGGGVSVEEYNALVEAHNRLVEQLVAERGRRKEAEALLKEAGAALQALAKKSGLV